MPLVVGVSTRPLFDFEDEHTVFFHDVRTPTRPLQHGGRAKTLRPGCACEIAKRLLALDPPGDVKLAEDVRLHCKSSDVALRALRSREHDGLAVFEGSFRSAKAR